MTDFEDVEAMTLLLSRGDYAIFRRWAILNRYGDSAAAFRALLALAGVLDEERAGGRS